MQRTSWLPAPLSLALLVASTPTSASASEEPPLGTSEVAPTTAPVLEDTATAAAQTGPAPHRDEVRLHDGGLVRGTILDLQPGVSVTIQRAADGTSATFPWAKVASTELGPRGDDRGLQQPEPPPRPPLAAPESGRGLPRLTIQTRSRRPVHIFTTGDSPMVMASTNSGSTTTMTAVRAGVALRSVCQAPCGEVIDARAGYPFFFGGDRMPLSRPVYLNYAEGDVSAEVRPGRLGLLMGGVFSVSYGAVGAITGGALLAVSPDRLAKPGGILLGSGAALLVAGIVMVVYGRTRYRLR